jgi:hypothetical protein
MARYGVDVTREPLAEMLEEHAKLRGLAMQLSDKVVSGKVRPETLREIGDQLEAHIRLEERVAFLLVEESLPEGTGGPARGQGGGPAHRAVGPRGGTLVRALAWSWRQRGRLRLRRAGLPGAAL